MSSEQLTVGQQVRVHRSSSKRPINGRIVKVGRSLVTIRYESTDIQFRIDTRRRASRPGDSRTWFETADEEPRPGREAAAVRVLRSVGVDVAVGHRVTLGLLEDLARAVRAPADRPGYPWQELTSWLRNMAARYAEARDQEVQDLAEPRLAYAYRGEADAYRKVLARMMQLAAGER